MVRSPHAGVIERVNYKEGDLVPEKKLLIVFQAPPADAKA